MLKNVKVPKENLVGNIEKGYLPVMENFNHGRFAMASTATRYSRVCLEDALLFSNQRQTFGKLIQTNKQPTKQSTLTRTHTHTHTHKGIKIT